MTINRPYLIFCGAINPERVGTRLCTKEAHTSGFTFRFLHHPIPGVHVPLGELAATRPPPEPPLR